MRKQRVDQTKMYADLGCRHIAFLHETGQYDQHGGKQSILHVTNFLSLVCWIVSLFPVLTISKQQEGSHPNVVQNVTLALLACFFTQCI